VSAKRSPEQKLVAAVFGTEVAAKHPRTTVPTFAYAYRSGHIDFGPRVPEGALPIGRLSRTFTRKRIEAGARLSRADNRTLFVPGVPEAPDDSAALEAFEAWLRWIKAPQAVTP
jgi:hypothetical protein